MIEVVGDLWTYPADWRIITTNGFVKKNGECVMGRGCAAEAKKKYPGLAQELGDQINRWGNHVWINRERQLITLPVKHNWYEKASLPLIEQSVAEMAPHIWFYGDKIYVMPRPGCGNGQLKWEDVKPLLMGLPDNVKVITWP